MMPVSIDGRRRTSSRNPRNSEGIEVPSGIAGGADAVTGFGVAPASGGARACASAGSLTRTHEIRMVAVRSMAGLPGFRQALTGCVSVDERLMTASLDRP